MHTLNITQDCILIKGHNYFNFIIMINYILIKQKSIISFLISGYRFRGENSVHIKSGTTSSGYTVTVIDQLDNIDNGIPYKDTEGFYIRLNGSYDSSDIFAFAYASYKPYHGIVILSFLTLIYAHGSHRS